MGDTHGKPGVFTSFSLDLGFPVVKECTFFQALLYNAGADQGFGRNFTLGL